MWCCSISPDHNRFQPRGRRAPDIGPPVCSAVEAQASDPNEGVYEREMHLLWL